MKKLERRIINVIFYLTKKIAFKKKIILQFFVEFSTINFNSYFFKK
jgi:hypothetical protein